MVKTKSSVRFFKTRKGWQKLIVNLVDSDHGLSSFVVRVSGPWDATSASDRGLVPTSWNMDSFQLQEPTSKEVENQALKLHKVLYNYRN